jgi:hypothetical protein
MLFDDLFGTGDDGILGGARLLGRGGRYATEYG